MNFKNTLFLCVAALLSAGASAQVKKKATPTTAHKTTPAAANAKPAATANLPVDPEVKVGKLPNGLTYYIRNNAQPKGRAELFLVTKGGSIVETDAQQGMANFIQHMAFKGTRDFPAKDIKAFLKKTRAPFGPDTSAYASYTETVYQMDVPTDTATMFEGGFKLLANWAAYMSFDPNAVNNEKVIAATQARVGGKTPQERLQMQILPYLLNNSKYAQRYPAGKESTINTFTDASLKSFYADWYRPDLQAVIVVGDFDVKRVEELIKFNFSSLRNPVAEKPLPAVTVPAVPGTVIKYATEKDYPYSLVQMVTRQPQTVVKTPADLMQNLRVTLFNAILSDRINEITQSPTPPMLFGQMSYGDLMGKQTAFSAIAVANKNGLESAVKTIVGETERMRKFGVTLTELERAKQNALLQVSNAYGARAGMPSASYALQYQRSFTSGNATPGISYEYNSVINNIGKITVPEMNALAAKVISDQNRVILIEGPESEKDKLPNEQTVLKWLAEADKGLTAYIDERTNPLMEKLPAPGKVVSSKPDSVLLIQNITLSNGVKVVLKPTQYTNNQILFAGYAFGGTSLANDQDFASANIAATVIANSGVAGFNPDQLSRMLNGKRLSVKPYISQTTQGVSGYASNDDFETAMQLLYLYFANPRKDADVWATVLNQAKAEVGRIRNDPGTVYQDTILAVLNSYNPREMSPTLNSLNTANLDKAYNFYKSRFADASNFTFTFTARSGLRISYRFWNNI